MDEDRVEDGPVDEVTSALARIRTRRNVLKAGLGAALAGIGLARTAPAAAAGRTGVVGFVVPPCASFFFDLTIEVENPTDGAMITFGLFAKRRGGEKFLDTGQQLTITLNSGQNTYDVGFDASNFQGFLPNGQTEYTALRVQAVGGAGGTFSRSVMRAKSAGVPPCGTPAPTTTTTTTTTTEPPTSAPPTTAAPTTTTFSTTTSSLPPPP
jgi:hypothetical protein